jgi:predicted transcriptional regulator
MVSVQLDATHEERLRALAAAQGRDVAEVVRSVLEDYLDLQANPDGDTPEKWAQASAAMAGEFYELDLWPDDENNR